MFSSCALSTVEPLREAVSQNKQLSELHLTGAPYFENALLQNIKRAVVEAISDWTLG